MIKVFRELVKAIDALTKAVRLRKPSRVFLVVRSGDSMLKFVLMLPAKSATDVVARRLSVQVDQNEPTSYDIEPSEQEFEDERFVGQDNAVVRGSLVDIDNAGNQSVPRDFEFILIDTIAPPQPGEIGLKVTEEIEG